MGRGEHVPPVPPTANCPLRPCISFPTCNRMPTTLKSNLLIRFKLPRDSAASPPSSSSPPTPSLNSIPISIPQHLLTTPLPVCCNSPSFDSSSQAERVYPSSSSLPASSIPLISSVRSAHEITMLRFHDWRKVLFEEQGGWCYPRRQRRQSVGSCANWAPTSWPREGMLLGFETLPQA